MTMRRCVVIGLAMVGLTLSGSLATAMAQEQDRQEQRQRRPRMPRLLGEDAPKVGQSLPDVEIYTDTGDKVRTSLLKGKYTVIVFGCLT